VIDVCLWLVLEAVVAAPAVAGVAVVVVVEALDEEARTPGGAGGGADGKDDVTGVAVVGVGGEPDSRESGGGSEVPVFPLPAPRPRMEVVSHSPLLSSLRP